LFRKKFIVLIFPQGTNRIKRLTVPKFFPILGLIFIIGFFLFSVLINFQYHSLRGELAELDRLRQITVKQNVQIYAFAHKVQRLQQEMFKLVQNSKKLQAMTADNRDLKRAATPALGGSDSALASPRGSLKASPESLIRQLHLDLDGLLAQTSFLEQNQQKLDKQFEDVRSLLVSTPTLTPAQGWISSGFGYRLHPLTQKREFHRGLDISAPRGTPIVSPANGIVVSKTRLPGYGLMLVINHGYGIITRYGHLHKAHVKPGQKVKRGEKIATVGASGRTTGPHLHYEVVRNGIPVNPIRYLAYR